MLKKKIKEIIKHFIDFIGEEDGFEEEAIDNAVDYIQVQLERNSESNPENKRKKYIITLSGCSGYTAIQKWLTYNEAQLIEMIAAKLNSQNSNAGVEELHIYSV